VLVLTTFDLEEYVYLALQAGAAGFLLYAPPHEIARAVEIVAKGEAILAPAVTKRLLTRFATGCGQQSRRGQAAVVPADRPGT
jgi:DNA-binding NarL/FixJ family response regulator